MTTYYTAKISEQWYIASGAWPTISDTAVDDLNAAHLVAADGDTLVISGGISGEVYSGTDFDADDGIDIARDNITLRKTSIDDPNYALHIGSIVFDGTDLADHIISNVAGISFNLIGINLRNADSGKFVLAISGAASVVTCSGCTLTGGILNYAKLTMNRCYLFGESGVRMLDTLIAAADVTLNYCWLMNGDLALRYMAGVGFTANNCMFAGFESDVFIQSDVSGLVSAFNNCIFVANNETTNYYTLKNNGVSGTMTATNCCILGTPKFGNTTLNMTDGGGNVYELPQFRDARRPGMITFTIDDTANRLLWDLTAQYATTKGLKTCFVINPDVAVTDLDIDDPLGCGWESLAARVSEGHEIVNHLCDHTYNAGEIVTQQGEQAFIDQLTEAKVWIEDKIPGFSCTSFAYTFGFYGVDEGVEQVVMNAVQSTGHTIARSMTMASPNRYLEDIEIYAMEGMPIPDIIGGFEGDMPIKQKIAAIIASAAWHGTVWHLYSHGDDGTYGHLGTAQFTLSQWQDLFDGIDEMNAHGYVKTLKECADIIRQGTDADGDGQRWTRDFTESDEAWNPAVSDAGPCWAAGTIVTGLHDQSDLVQDINGDAVYYIPTVGPVESQGHIKSITDDNYTPSGYEIRKGATVRIRGAGHVDLSGLSDTDGEIDVILHSEIDQFTPATAGVSTPIRPFKRAGTVMLGGPGRGTGIG